MQDRDLTYRPFVIVGVIIRSRCVSGLAVYCFHYAPKGSRLEGADRRGESFFFNSGRGLNTFIIGCSLLDIGYSKITNSAPP